MRFDQGGYPVWPGQRGFTAEDDYMPKPRRRPDYFEPEVWPCLWCFACGRSAQLSDVPDHWYGLWRLDAAHLSAGSGRALRKLDRRAVILLCSRCHALHTHHASMRQLDDGQEVSTLTDANTIWLKRARDPENYDPEFVAAMWLGAVPQPVPPDEWYLEQYEARHGRSDAGGMGFTIVG